MSSPKFERVKSKHPDLSGLLDLLASYVQAQTKQGQTFILPKLAGAALGLTDGEAFVLLELLADEGVLERVYNVYCRATGMLLDTVHDARRLGEVPHCDFCDRFHDSRELKLELAFAPLDRNLIDKAA